MLQPVSVQRDAGHNQEATATALHQLDHHGILVISHGFFVILNAEVSVLDHIANSSIFSFQIEFIHASFNFFITLASYGGTKFFNIFEAHVVFTHFSQ
jgi:hypothetical protein